MEINYRPEGNRKFFKLKLLKNIYGGKSEVQMNGKLGGSLGDQSQFTTWVEGGEGFLGGSHRFQGERRVKSAFSLGGGDCRKLTVKWGGGGGRH